MTVIKNVKFPIAAAFTAFIMSEHREDADPFISSVTCSGCVDQLRAAIIAEYNLQYDRPDAFEESNARIVGLCMGEQRYAWNPEGLDDAEFHYVLPVPAPAIQEAAADIKKDVSRKARFPEIETMPIISTSHISPENLNALNAMECNRGLPYWITHTGFGWIVRFETAVKNWEAGMEDQQDLMHPFQGANLDDTFSALCCDLAGYGFQAVHLDCDADEIEGLQTYEH